MITVFKLGNVLLLDNHSKQSGKHIICDGRCWRGWNDGSAWFISQGRDGIIKLLFGGVGDRLRLDGTYTILQKQNYLICTEILRDAEGFMFGDIRCNFERIGSIRLSKSLCLQKCERAIKIDEDEWDVLDMAGKASVILEYAEYITPIDIAKIRFLDVNKFIANGDVVYV